MKHITKFPILATVWLALHIFSPPLQAENVAIFDSPHSNAMTRSEVERVLKMIDPDGYKAVDETAGFTTHFTDRWSSPYSYDFFIGPVSTKDPQPVIRIEGPDGEVRILSRALELEGVINPRFNPDNLANIDPLNPDPNYVPGYKYHFFSQSLNLVAPWIAVWYHTYDSPLYSSNQTWVRFILYFIADAFVVYAGGTNGFQERFQPDKYWYNIAAGLAAVRMVGAIQSFNYVRANNRVAELKYSFDL